MNYVIGILSCQLSIASRNKYSLIYLFQHMDDQTQITYIGKVDHRNKMTKFGIKPKDRTKHMYIIGKTGTGKSTFLENMIVQDIQNGHGVAFIDPHGGSAEKLLDYIPEWRVNDVIYLNPADVEFPVAFNPLEDLGPAKRPLIADGLMSVFKKIWPEAFSGRMEYILNNTMLALLEYPEPSVLGINRMLTDKDYRKKVVANVTDPTVRNAWDELMKWDDKRWSEASGALINKVGQFSTNPIVRNIIGQTKSTFDFRKAMDERKIIIINLSKGQIGEQNAPLLGAMLITKIYLAAMSRAELSAHVIDKMAPFYFYVDEFQNFANDSFANILSEARKYKLCLTVANQYIAQMDETIRDAVFGNMGTTISFRVGPLDAEFMEKVFAPVFTMDDLQNIAFGQYYLTLQIDNMGSKPFSAQGLPPIPPLLTSMRTQVIEASRKQFARPYQEVNETITEWFGYNKKPEDKVIRTDVGSAENPAGRPATVTTYKPTYSQPPRKETITAAAVPKPLPEISGYEKKKPISVNQPPRQETKPVQNSASLNDLLSKLDDAVVVPAPPVKPIEPVAPRPEPVAKPIPQPKPALVMANPVQKPASSVPQKLDRAAGSDKKSALAEALAKAMAQSKGAPKEQVVEAKQAEEPIKWVLPDQAPEPEAKFDLEPIQVPVPPTPQVTPVPPVIEPEPIPQVPPRPPVNNASTTIREVPEDILRRVLEE